MKTENDLITEILELYEFHKNKSRKYLRILGILGYDEPADEVIEPSVTPKKKTVQKVNNEVLEAICKNPECGQAFTQTIKNKKGYCSKRCYQHCYLKTWYEKNPNYKKKKTNGKELNVKEALAKIKKEILFKEVERPTIYHDC